MSKPKVLLTGRIPDDVRAVLEKACAVEDNREDRPMERARVLDLIKDKDGLLSMITDSVDGELMDRAPRLRMIANMAVGYNNIDVKAATARGIPVSNTPGVLTDATAELAFALILAAARRIADSGQAHKDGASFATWASHACFVGTEVTGNDPWVSSALEEYGKAVGPDGPGGLTCGSSITTARGWDPPKSVNFRRSMRI